MVHKHCWRTSHWWSVLCHVLAPPFTPFTPFQKGYFINLLMDWKGTQRDAKGLLGCSGCLCPSSHYCCHLQPPWFHILCSISVSHSPLVVWMASILSTKRDFTLIMRSRVIMPATSGTIPSKWHSGSSIRRLWTCTLPISGGSMSLSNLMRIQVFWIQILKGYDDGKAEYDHEVGCTATVLAELRADAAPSFTYKTAKKTPFPNTMIAQLTSAYGATEFLPALQVFLEHNMPHNIRTLKPNQFDHFDIYNAISILLPSKPPTPAHFDTAVIIEDEEAYEEGQIAGTSSWFYCNLILICCILDRPPCHRDLSNLQATCPVRSFLTTSCIYPLVHTFPCLGFTVRYVQIVPLDTTVQMPLWSVQTKLSRLVTFCWSLGLDIFPGTDLLAVYLIMPPISSSTDTLTFMCLRSSLLMIQVCRIFRAILT